MATEDFTTYTEVDPNGRLTVTASKADVVNAERDEDVYLYKDKGADHFDALDILFEIYVGSASAASSFGGMAISNTVGTMAQFATTDMSCPGSGGVDYLYLMRGAFVATDYYNCSQDTLYYCTLARAAGNNTATLKIYSDASRTDLLDTLAVAGFSTTKFRYCYGMANYNSGAATYYHTGYVQDLDLQEAAPPPGAMPMAMNHYRRWRN